MSDPKSARVRTQTERVYDFIERNPGAATMSIARSLMMPELAVTQSIMELRTDRKVRVVKGGWRPITVSMLVPELGLQNTQRNRRWLAYVKRLGDLMPQEKAEVLAWEMVHLWEETK